MSEKDDYVTIDSEEARIEFLFKDSDKMETPARLGLIEKEITHNKRLLVLMNKTLISHAAEYDDYRVYVKTKIEEEKAKRDFWRNVGKQAAVTGTLGAIGLIASALWYAFKSFIQEIQ